MFDEDDIEVVDDNLSREKHNGLHSLTGGDRNTCRKQGLQSWTGLSQEVRCDYRHYTRQHGSLYTEAEFDQQIRAAEAYESFQHEVQGQRRERVYSLYVAAADAE